jgi:hypothetical protein
MTALLCLLAHHLQKQHMMDEVTVKEHRYALHMQHLFTNYG